MRKPTLEMIKELKKYSKLPNVTINWCEKTKKWGFLACEYNNGSYWVGWMI